MFFDYLVKIVKRLNIVNFILCVLISIIKGVFLWYWVAGMNIQNNALGLQTCVLDIYIYANMVSVIGFFIIPIGMIYVIYSQRYSFKTQSVIRYSKVTDLWNVHTWYAIKISVIWTVESMVYSIAVGKLMGLPMNIWYTANSVYYSHMGFTIQVNTMGILMLIALTIFTRIFILLMIHLVLAWKYMRFEYILCLLAILAVFEYTPMRKIGFYSSLGIKWENITDLRRVLLIILSGLMITIYLYYRGKKNAVAKEWM